MQEPEVGDFVEAPKASGIVKERRRIAGRLNVVIHSHTTLLQHIPVTEITKITKKDDIK